MKKPNWVIIAVLGIIVAGVGIWIGVFKFEREKPTIQIIPDSRYLGQKITVKVEDRKSGVAEVRVEAIQKGKTVTLLTERFPKGTPNVEKTLALLPLPQGLKDGETQMKFLARDHSWNKGNPVSLERNVVLDTHPPQITVFGPLHYINKGGTGLVTYQTSEETPVSGVQIGDLFFPGYSQGKNQYLAYFASSHTADKRVSVSAVAKDHAGNRTKTGFRLILKSKAFKKDKIQITEGFLKNVIPYFTERDPSLQGTPLENFLAVNRKQREKDHREIKNICQQMDTQPLWSGPFLRLPNSKPMASFAEDRTYWYDGKEIDRQVHLGVDLASIAQSPVPAANSGRVAFAGPLGIYGNTVMIDHGCGLFSMYSHLSRIETEVKKEVKKGEILGRTGTTGLAGGDHLHFSMLVNGVFVNPIEWWDEHWIKDNIEKKMKF
ncbi:MAG: M23 family metallopeptidase [Proteobacteria bacterium]|nr:M23 family metallopeptidase [Pseudomonadota bacterium]